MKTAAMSVWIFMNLLCFGMCGYIYLIWSQYWMYMEKQKHSSQALVKFDFGVSDMKFNKMEKKVPVYLEKTQKERTTEIVHSLSKSPRSAIGPFSTDTKSSNLFNRPLPNVVKKTFGRPRFPNTHKPILEFDNVKHTCLENDNNCEAKTIEFKETILKELQRVLMEHSDVFKSGVESQNPYRVQYNASMHGPYVERNKTELLCQLKKINVKTIKSTDDIFAKHGFSISDENVLHEQKTFKNCMVVTSAGAMFGSSLGIFIDNHDMVLRFNNAPTENFTQDVGSKTTFRVLNSQVVSKPEFAFLDSQLFQNISILIWDPAKHFSTLEQWYHNPDYPLFSVYKQFLEKNPGVDAHLLHPAVLWELWQFLQINSPYRLRKNPPSSGFIGIWLSLHRCERVHVAEFVPSSRVRRRCHYMSARADAACTLGAWHPLAQEKTLVERMRTNSDYQVFQRGYAEITGFSNVKC